MQWQDNTGCRSRESRKKLVLYHPNSQNEKDAHSTNTKNHDTKQNQRSHDQNTSEQANKKDDPSIVPLLVTISFRETIFTWFNALRILISRSAVIGNPFSSCSVLIIFNAATSCVTYMAHNCMSEYLDWIFIDISISKKILQLALFLKNKPQRGPTLSFPKNTDPYVPCPTLLIFSYTSTSRSPAHVLSRRTLLAALPFNLFDLTVDGTNLGVLWGTVEETVWACSRFLGGGGGGGFERSIVGYYNWIVCLFAVCFVVVMLHVYK